MARDDHFKYTSDLNEKLESASIEPRLPRWKIRPFCAKRWWT